MIEILSKIQYQQNIVYNTNLAKLLKAAEWGFMHNGTRLELAHLSKIDLCNRSVQEQ